MGAPQKPPVGFPTSIGIPYQGCARWSVIVNIQAYISLTEPQYRAPSHRSDGLTNVREGASLQTGRGRGHAAIHARRRRALLSCQNESGTWTRRFRLRQL